MEDRTTPASFSTSVTVTSSSNPADAGQPVIFSAMVMVNANGASFPAPGGAVQFSSSLLVNGISSLPVNLGTAIIDSQGRAAIEAANLPIGFNRILASYGGHNLIYGPFLSDTLLQSQGSVVQTVNSAPAVLPAKSNPVPTSTVPSTRVSSVALSAQGSWSGSASGVKAFNRDGTPRFAADPFPGFTGGIRVATGDVNGDGTDDLIAVPGPGRSPTVQVFDGRNGVLLRSFAAFEMSFLGGVYVAAGDVNKDGFDDIVLSPEMQGRFRVLSGSDTRSIADF